MLKNASFKIVLNFKEFSEKDKNVQKFWDDAQKEINRITDSVYGDQSIKNAKIIALRQLQLLVFKHNNIATAMYSFLNSPYKKGQTYYDLFCKQRRTGCFFSIFNPRKTSTQKLIDKYFNNKKYQPNEKTHLLTY